MAKRDFPEVRSMIEFDRLAKNHLMDAYSQLLPTTKRLIRKLNSSDQQTILPQQIQHSVFNEEDIGVFGEQPRSISLDEFDIN